MRRLLFRFAVLASCCGAGTASAQTAFPGIAGFTFAAADSAYTLAVTDPLSAFGLTIVPADLSFRFTPGATAADDGLALFGTAAVTFEETSLTVSFGTSDDPSVTATGTTLDAFAASLSGTFAHAGLTFTADDAGLAWSGTGDRVALYGTVTLAFDGESLSASLGDAADPGFVVEGGTVTSVSVDLPDPISLKGLPLTPTDLGMAWNGASDRYAAWGTASLTLDGSDWTVRAGDAASPGIVIDDGTLTALDLSVSGSLDLDGFSAAASDLTVAWNRDEDDVELSGTGTVTLDGQTLAFTLGDAADPGVSIRNGTLQDLDLSLTGTLKAAGMDLVIDHLTLVEQGTDLFEAYGAVTVAVGGKSMTLTLGDAADPGMRFAQGTLLHFSASATGTISAESVDFTMDGLTIDWNQGGDLAFYGTASVDLDGNTTTIDAGTSTDPGLKLESGSLTHLHVGVTADFTLHGIGIAPKDLTLVWDAATSSFYLYGELDVTFAGDTVDALLGTSDDPGLTLRNGAITEVNIGITSDLKVGGLAVKTDALTFAWTGGTTYDLYGEADLSVGGDDLDTDFGDAADPGIQIRNGSLHSLSVDINSDLKLGNLEVKTKDLTVNYSSSKFVVSGEITVTEVFEVDVTLGTSDNPGLEIDVDGSTPRFKVEDLKVSIKHADLGGIDIKNITLEFTSSGVKDAEVDVAFPGGSEVDAEIQFTGNPARIDAVKVSYRADNLSEAIELFEGVQVAYISGTVENLAGSRKTIHNFGIKNETKTTRSPYVSATLQTIYGGGVTFGGHSATFLEMSDQVTIYDFGLSFDADINVGAYRKSSSSNEWDNVFGSGSVDVVLDYGEYGYISGSVSLPYVTANASVYTDSHKDFDALVDVHFCFPSGSKYWPVSGKCFGSIDGAIRYKNGSPNSSYGAGWTRVKTFWHTYHPGGKYNLGSRSFSFSLDLDSGAIESDIHSDESAGAAKTGAATPYIQHVSTFEVGNDEAHSLLVRMNWHEVVDTAYVTVVGPDGYHELMQVYVTDEDGGDGLPAFGTASNFDLVVADSLANFFVTAATTIDSVSTVNETLLPGTYSVYLTYAGDAALDLDLSVEPFVDPGSIALAGTMDEDERTVALDLAYRSSAPDSTVISWYRADEADYTGRLVERQEGAALFDDGQDGSMQVVYAPDRQAGVDTLWFYAVLDDGANPMQYSNLAGPFVFEPDVRGVVADLVPEDSVAAGSFVYVDDNGDGHWDTDSTDDLEPHGTAGLDGAFTLNGLSPGTHVVRVLLPDGYRLAGATDGVDGVAVSYTGAPLVLNLTIERDE